MENTITGRAEGHDDNKSEGREQCEEGQEEKSLCVCTCVNMCER